MLKITKLSEMERIPNLQLRAYICEKTKKMMTEYDVDNLDDIGCFIVLEQSEYQKFDIAAMEFVEILAIENEMYLHGVRILGDSYGEDIYLPVGVVEC